MRGGKATGEDREYQVFCRDILVKDEPNLRPLAGDGIDVPIEAGGTTYSFDVALTDGRRLVVAECKRWQKPVSQGELALFAYKAELLREERSTEQGQGSKARGSRGARPGQGQGVKGKARGSNL
jgi:hypothetical protein